MLALSDASATQLSLFHVTIHALSICSPISLACHFFPTSFDLSQESLLAKIGDTFEASTPVYEKKSTYLTNSKDIPIVHHITSNSNPLHSALYENVPPYQVPEGNKGHHNRSFSTRG